MTWGLRSVCNFLCCGLINLEPPEKEESNPLLSNAVNTDYRDSSHNGPYESSYSQISPKKFEASSNVISHGTSRNTSKASIQASIESTDKANREHQIKKCRKDLKSQLSHRKQKVKIKRAKSLPSNTSLLSHMSQTANFEYEDDLEPTVQESSGDLTRWKSPLSQHVLRNWTTTPSDSGHNMAFNNVPLWQQLDNLIMDERPPRRR